MPVKTTTPRFTRGCVFVLSFQVLRGRFWFCGAVYGFGRSSLFSDRSDIYETDVPVQMVFADNRDRKAGFVSGNREWPIFWDGKAVFARNMRLSFSEKCFWVDFRDICPWMRRKVKFLGL